MRNKKLITLSLILVIFLVSVVVLLSKGPYFKDTNETSLVLRQSLEAQEIALRKQAYSSMERPLDCAESVFSSSLSLEGIYGLFLIGPNRCYLDSRTYDYLDAYLNLRDDGKIYGAETLDFVTHITAWFKAEVPYINNLTELLIFSFYIQRVLEAKVVLANQNLLNTFYEAKSSLTQAWQNEQNSMSLSGQYFINIRASIGAIVAAFE